MVAVVHESKSLRRCLNYNEEKVKAGVAKCLEAGYYPMEAQDMNFYQKLRCLELLTELNQRTKVNAVHVSLNFHPSEKPSEALLKEIAEVFLEKIGFAGQPYLVYQHYDSGHPHIHLLTTNIKADGKAINLHNIGSIRAQEARIAIEKEYGLVVASDRKNDLTERFKPVNVQRALYGKMETKRAMNGIINVVTGSYNFTSLAQLNAVLGLYNIVADTGGEGSRVLKHEGLVFRMLDAEGNKVGVPIKASDFYGKPTLKKLREKFEKNKPLRDKAKRHLRTLIDGALFHKKLSLEGLCDQLKNKGIDTIIRRGEGGVIYGITYVDHVKKAVVNGSELRKAYSAKAILERCQGFASGQVVKAAVNKQKSRYKKNDLIREPKGVGDSTPALPGLAETLLDVGDLRESMDWELNTTRKKRKKRIRLSS